MKRIFLFLIFYFIAFNFSYAQKSLFFEKSPKKYKIKRYITTEPNNKINKTKLINIVCFFKSNQKQINLCFGKCKTKNLFKCNSNNFSTMEFLNDTLFITFHDVKEPLFIFKKENIGDTSFLKNVFFPISNHFIFLEDIQYYSDLDDEVYIFNLNRVSEIQEIEKNKLYKTTSIDYYYFEKIAISKKYGFVWIRYSYLGANIEIWYR